MVDQTEQINRLLRKESGAAISQDEMGAMFSQMDSGDPAIQREIKNYYEDVARAKENVRGPYMEEELNMIGSAQQGLMDIDPEATRDVVEGLELTKQKVMAGETLSEEESTGIMAILQKLGGAFSGMMGGGETKSYMVDGKVVEMTDREMMGAKNAGILVQDVESGIRDMEMGTYMVDGNPVEMTPMQYQDAVESGSITPNR